MFFDNMQSYLLCQGSPAVPNIFPGWYLLIPMLSLVGMEEWNHPMDQGFWTDVSAHLHNRTCQVEVSSGLIRKQINTSIGVNLHPYTSSVRVWKYSCPIHIRQSSCISPVRTSSLHWARKSWRIPVTWAPCSCKRHSNENKMTCR